MEIGRAKHHPWIQEAEPSGSMLEQRLSLRNTLHQNTKIQELAVQIVGGKR